MASARGTFVNRLEMAKEHIKTEVGIKSELLITLAKVKESAMQWEEYKVRTGSRIVVSQEASSYYQNLDDRNIS